MIEVDGGKLNLFLGNYDDYLYKKQLEKEEDQREGKTLPPGETILLPIRRKTPYQLKEERKKEAYQRDQYRRQLQGIEKKLQEVERSLNEATEELDQRNQRLSEPSLYLNKKDTYETIQTHRRTKEWLKEFPARWEFLSLELEQAKGLKVSQ